MRFDPLDAACASLPATWKVVQWGGLHVWKVGPKDASRAKMFAVLSPEGHRGDGGNDAPSATVTLKVAAEREPFLRELPGIGAAPHLPRGGWLLFGPRCPLGEDDLAAYAAESHALVRRALTRAAREACGLG